MSLWQVVTPETLHEVVQQTMSLLIESDARPDAAAPSYHGDDLSMAVYCDKDQQSAVLMRCSHSLAMLLTSRMLEMPADEIQRADLLDAAGEVVNVIAGSLRGLLPELSSMSTPFELPLEELEQYATAGSSQYRVGEEQLQLLLV